MSKLTSYWYWISLTRICHRIIGGERTMCKMWSRNEGKTYCAVLCRNQRLFSTSDSPVGLRWSARMRAGKCLCRGSFGHSLPSEWYGGEWEVIGTLRQPWVSHAAGEVYWFVLCNWWTWYNRSTHRLRIWIYAKQNKTISSITQIWTI